MWDFNLGDLKEPQEKALLCLFICLFKVLSKTDTEEDSNHLKASSSRKDFQSAA